MKHIRYLIPSRHILEIEKSTLWMGHNSQGYQFLLAELKSVHAVFKLSALWNLLRLQSLVLKPLTAQLNHKPQTQNWLGVSDALICIDYRHVFALPDIYNPRRSIIFITKDTSYLDISSAEFIEENRREYGERAVAYVSINNALSKGKWFNVWEWILSRV